MKYTHGQGFLGKIVTNACVEVEYVAKQLAANKTIIVDSRPKKAKFDKGHIPSAISFQ